MTVNDRFYCTYVEHFTDGCKPRRRLEITQRPDKLQRTRNGLQTFAISPIINFGYSQQLPVMANARFLRMKEMTVVTLESHLTSAKRWAAAGNQRLFKENHGAFILKVHSCNFNN